MNVASPILSVLVSSPSRLAIREPNGASLDYAGLHARIVALAVHLRDQGLTPGDRVVLQTPQGICFAASAIAVLLAGGVPVLCEPGLGDTVYLSRIQAAAPRWLLTHPAVLAIDRVPRLRTALARREIDVPPVPPSSSGMRRVVVSRASLDRLARTIPASTAFEPASRQPADDGVIVFTGGTTTMPKGVRLSHGALEHYLSNIRHVVSDTPVERFLADTPQQVLYALRLGRSAFTTKGRKQKRARSVLELVRSGQVDAYFGSPYVWVEMMRATGDSRAPLPSSLRTVLLGSAPVTPEFLRSMRAWLHPATRVYVLYGLTEVGPVSVVSAEDKIAWSGQGDLVGHPLQGIDVRIDGAAPGADVGEVVIRSASMYSGYLGEPPGELQRELRTGDLGRVVRQGDRDALVLLGRAKDMIIRRGVNIYPSTLESSIRALRDSQGRPLLRECALIGEWNPSRQDEDLVLCVQPWRSGDTLELDALRTRIVAIVGPDAAPDRLIVLDPIPVTGRQNKVDKQAVRALASRGTESRQPREGASAAAASEPPRDDPWAWLPGARMPFGWRAFARKYGLLARRRDARGAVAGQLVFRLALLGIAQSAWALDELVHPDWRRASAIGPLFILGHQRSGTTFLHRLLSGDRTHARALSLQEMLLPAVSVQQGLARMGDWDARLGGRLRTRFDALQDRLFGPLDDIHRLRFDEIEEDEFVLWSVFESGMCANDAPIATEMAGLDELRRFETWPVGRQARALGYYRACLLKKLARDPSETQSLPRWIVSKNPAFTHKVPQLERVFPDARFIYLVRNPLQTIPSRLSLIQAIWRRRFPSFQRMNSSQVEVIFADSVRTYLAAERDLPTLPEQRRLTLPYQAFVQDPIAAVRAIYQRFDLPGPDRHLDAMLETLASSREPRRSAHRYTAAEFGLDEARIRRELAPVFERYDFG